MATTRQLIDELALLREPSEILTPSVVTSATPPVSPVATPLVTDPNPPSLIRDARPVPSPLPPVPDDTEPAARPAIPAPQVDTPSSNSFYDMLLMNDAYRLQNKEAFERNEKANKARTAIAAVTDALASLGNLVGTTQGAFSQPQTYQTPFVTEQVEADRKEARKLAQAIEDNDMSLRLTQAKYDAENGLYGSRLALEQAKTDRAMALALERAKLAEQNAGYKSELEGTKHGYRTDEIAQRGEIQKEVTQMRNEQSDLNNRRATGTSAANNIRNNETKKEVGSGNVGGYTTRTEIEYDELGHKVGETKTRTREGGATTTTTTTAQGGSSSSSASKTPPSRQQSAQGGSDKTPPSKKKKDNTKTPPSKRK